MQSVPQRRAGLASSLSRAAWAGRTRCVSLVAVWPRGLDALDGAGNSRHSGSIASNDERSQAGTFLSLSTVRTRYYKVLAIASG